MQTDVRMIQLLMELRRQGITDTEVLSAMETTPRELFVPDVFRDRAYDNVALPVDAGQTISQPYVVAYMTAQLELKATHRVLEVGTGTGYAIYLAAAAGSVIERNRLGNATAGASSGVVIEGGVDAHAAVSVTANRNRARTGLRKVVRINSSVGDW